MTKDTKLQHGTAEWFEMVGTMLCLCPAAPSTLNLSLVER